MWRVVQLAPYRRLVTTSLLNELATSIGAVALALLVYRRTGSAFGATAYFLCAQFGPALISPFLVARLDQRAARTAIGVLYALEAAVFAVLVWVAHHFSLPWLLALALVDGTLALTGRVLSRAAWVPIVTPQGLLREANAVMNSAMSVFFLLGPAAGGLLVALGGTVAALWVNVGVFVVISGLAATTRGLPRPVAEGAPTAGRLRAALAHVRTEPVIRRLLSLQAIAMVFFTLATPVEVVLVRHSLHAGAGGYGALLSLWGAGAILGSAAYGRWRELPARVLITAGTGLLGIGFLGMAVAPSLAVALVGAVVAGAGNGIQIVAARTAVQELAPERWMALIVSLNESMYQAVPGVGFLVGGVITALAGPRVALGAGAAGSLAVGVAIWVGLRQVTPASPPALAPDPETPVLEAAAAPVGRDA